MKPIHIAILADSENNTNLTTLFLSSEFAVVGQFTRLQQIECIQTYDIIIVDTEWTENSALDVIKFLVNKYMHTKIIAICPHLDVEQARMLIRIGVAGILLEHELEDNFTHFVHTIYGGQVVISPAILKKLLPPKSQ